MEKRKSSLASLGFSGMQFNERIIDSRWRLLDFMNSKPKSMACSRFDFP